MSGEREQREALGFQKQEGQDSVTLEAQSGADSEFLAQ